MHVCSCLLFILKVRTMLEEDTQMELKEYRSFIDEEMITILGQMDSASHIFDHVYLVSRPIIILIQPENNSFY